MREKLCDELRLQLERDSRFLNTIQKRAAHLILITGVISAVFIGLTDILPNPWSLIPNDASYSLWLYILIILAIILPPVISIATLPATMILCLIILIVNKTSADPINSDALLHKRDNEYVLNQNKYDEWTNLDPDQYYKRLSIEYLKLITDRKTDINDKKYWFNRAAVFAIISVFATSISWVVPNFLIIKT